MRDSGINGSRDSKETAAPLHTIGEIVGPSPSQPQSAASNRENEHSFYRPIESTVQLVRKTPPLAVPAIVAMVFIRQAKRVTWRNRWGNADRAAVVIVLALACCTAYSDRGTFSASSYADRPKTTSLAEDSVPAPQKLTAVTDVPALSAEPIPTKKHIVAPKRVKADSTSRQRVVHFGNDVTVRYFEPASVPHTGPTNAYQAVRKGNDVTVRYFPPVRNDSKTNSRPANAADRKRLGFPATTASEARESPPKVGTQAP